LSSRFQLPATSDRRPDIKFPIVIMDRLEEEQTQRAAPDRNENAAFINCLDWPTGQWCLTSVDIADYARRRRSMTRRATTLVGGG
jgi:hypothetical protein